MIRTVDKFTGVTVIDMFQSMFSPSIIRMAARDVKNNNRFNTLAKKYCGNDINIKPTNNKVHDRFIFIDYGTDIEKAYLCGPSSKDAGSKISVIVEVNNTHMFHEIIDELNR